MSSQKSATNAGYLDADKIAEAAKQQTERNNPKGKMADWRRKAAARKSSWRQEKAQCGQ